MSNISAIGHGEPQKGWGKWDNWKIHKLTRNTITVNGLSFAIQRQILRLENNVRQMTFKRK